MNPRKLLVVCATAFFLYSGDVMSFFGLFDQQKPADFFDGPVLAFAEAALEHDENTLKRLRNAGVNPNFLGKDRMTPLILAVLKQDRLAIQMLMRNGADAEMMIQGVGSALHVACRDKDTTSLVAMLDAGANPSLNIGGEPLSFTAVKNDRIEPIKVLFSRGLSIEARNTSGDTLLIQAIMVNDIEFAGWLIEQGANVHAISGFLISAAASLQSRLNEAGPNSVNTPRYLKLKAMFEARGVTFPVPTRVELMKRFGKSKLPLEQVINMDERGEPLQQP